MDSTKTSGAEGPNDGEEPVEQSKQSKGGEARARKLSKEERSARAREAAAAKWKWPRATHEGPLDIGGLHLDCATLESGLAVISETKFMAAIGLYRSGALSTRRDDGEKVPLHLAHKNLRPFVEKHFGKASGPDTCTYLALSGSLVDGIPAEALPTICEVWLDAREAGVLGGTQLKVAGFMDALIRSFARVGIVALVHEATGYQYERQRDALAEMLRAILSDKLSQWVKTFPNAYFRELCRLKNVAYRPDMKLPQYFGHFTNDIVYKRLAPTLLEHLQERNPREPDGRRKSKHFQHLSESTGNPRLMQHLGTVVGLMKISEDWETFKRHLDRVAPIREALPLFPEEID